MLEQIIAQVITSLIAPASSRVVKFLINCCLNGEIPEEILSKRQSKKSTETVPTESQANLNDPKDNGLGTKENLEINAHKGDIKAQFNLGVLYYNGHGTPKSYVLAYMWWSIAGANGHEEANGKLAIVSRKITRAGIEKAQEKANEMTEENPSLIKSQIN